MSCAPTATRVKLLQATIMTSVSLDHMAILGDTHAAIAREKSGIFRAGVPVVTGPLPESAAVVVAEVAASLGCPVTAVDDACVRAAGPGLYEVVVPGADPVAERTYRTRVPLYGPCQRTNAAVAVAALHSARQRGWHPDKLTRDAIERGVGLTTWRGRMEWQTWQGCRILLDGAHNEGAGTALRQYVDEVLASSGGSTAVLWVIGMLTSKDATAFLRTVLRPAAGDRILPVLVKVAKEFAWLYPRPPTEIATAASAAGGDGVLLEGWSCDPPRSLADALATAVEVQPPAALVVVCGSLNIVREFYEVQQSAGEARGS